VSHYVLPSHWTWRTPADLAAPDRYALAIGPFGSNLKVIDYRPSGTPVIFVRNIRTGDFDGPTAQFVSPLKATELAAHRVDPGDLLVTKMGDPPGDACIYPAHRPPGIITADCIKFRVAAGSASVKYLAYAIASPAVRSQILERTKGVAQQKISLETFRTLRLPVAPREEQDKIVAEIDKQFTRLDAGVEALKRLQAHLGRYRAAVLKAACEGRLVPTEATLAKRDNRPYEPASALIREAAARRRHHWEEDLGKASYFEPAHLEEQPGPLPEGWAWATFEQMAGRITVGHVGPMKEEYIESGIPFLRSQNVRENRFERDGLLFVSPDFHAKLRKSVLHPGDIAIVRSGSVGTACVVPESVGEANCSDLVIVQRPLGLIPEFGAFYMNSLARARIRAGQVGIALTHFNTKSVAALPVPVPPLAEQRRIVAEVEARFSILKALELAVEASFTRASRLRSAILRSAFEGRLFGAGPPRASSLGA